MTEQISISNSPEPSNTEYIYSNIMLLCKMPNYYILIKIIIFLKRCDPDQIVYKALVIIIRET